MNGNLKWCGQEKINNKQNSDVQEKDKYNDVIKKCLHKINEQRRNFLILRKYYIENYKAFKKLCINVETAL